MSVWSERRGLLLTGVSVGTLAYTSRKQRVEGPLKAVYYSCDCIVTLMLKIEKIVAFHSVVFFTLGLNLLITKTHIKNTAKPF